MPNVIGVAASDTADHVAGFSNTGSAAVAAPGVAIDATAPGGGYTTVSGTSAASAEVAGLAAMLAANGANAASQIPGASDPIAGHSFGRINVAKALGVAVAPVATATVGATPTPGETPIYEAATGCATSTCTITVSPATVSTSSTGNTLKFTLAVSGSGVSFSNQNVTVLVPSGWSAPSTTLTAAGYSTASNVSCTAMGAVSIAGGNTISVAGVSCASGQSMTITYGSKAGSGPRFGPGNSAAARAEQMVPGPRKTPDSTLPEASATIRSETDDAVFAHPEAEKDPRENKAV